MTVFVADYDFVPMSNTVVFSTFENAILDEGVTDAAGFVELAVADGAFLTIHDPYSSVLDIKQSFLVLPTDDSLAIRFRFRTDLPANLETISAQVAVSGVPGDFLSGQITSGFNGDFVSPANGTFSLDIDPWRSEQANERYSVFGFAYDPLDPSEYYYGVSTDHAFTTTSLSLVLQPDPGAEHQVDIVNLPGGWSWAPYASPRRGGIPIAPSSSPTPGSSSITHRLRGLSAADSVVESVSIWGPSGSFLENRWSAGAPSDWTLDASVHPPTITIQAVTVDTAGRIGATWMTETTGDADHGHVLVEWRDETGVRHVWLLVLPPWTGTISLPLPPVPSALDSTTQRNNLVVSILYVELDHLTGYLESRYPPPMPGTAAFRYSTARNGVPSLFWYPAE